MWNLAPSASAGMEEGHVDSAAEVLHCVGILVRPPGRGLHRHRRAIPIGCPHPGIRVIAVVKLAGEVSPLEEQEHGVTINETSTRKSEARAPSRERDRKSTRLNSSHANISYAVFCL